jgi:hypothetical protein
VFSKLSRGTISSIACHLEVVVCTFIEDLLMERLLLEDFMEDVGVCHGLIPSLMETSYLHGAFLLEICTCGLTTTILCIFFMLVLLIIIDELL